MPRYLVIDNVKINVDSLSVVEDAATILSPTMFAVTATCVKESNGHIVVAELSRSPFKEVSNTIVEALKVYSDHLSIKEMEDNSFLKPTPRLSGQ